MSDIIDRMTDLIQKANEDSQVSMSHFDDAASIDKDAEGFVDYDVATLDSDSNEIQVGDLVNDVHNSNKTKGIVVSIQDVVLVEWPDGNKTKEPAINLILTELDD